VCVTSWGAVWYGPAFVRGCSSTLAARRLALCLGAVAIFGLPAAGGVASPANRVAELRDRADSLRAQERAATLDVYALDSELASARSTLASLRARSESAEAELRSLRLQVDAAWQSSFVAERRLADRIRQVYQTDPADAVTVLLGAQSVDEAINGLESLRRLATQDRELVDQLRRSRSELTRAKRRVAARAAALREAESAAVATAARLESARAERQAYLARLAAARGFTAQRIAQVREVARAAARRSVVTSAPATSTSDAAAPAPVVLSGNTLTVEASGYAIRGTTATGLPTGWGVVAVDPSVIPLGTRLSIPGYGEGVAADTGGAVRGAHIDLWFPSIAEALVWGRRTVTVTINP
jgi:3D (Asp-Asp-Asp) domain-containing protein